MPRSRGRSGPAPRPHARANHTMAAPQSRSAPAPVHAAPPQHTQQPGLFGQMASTAAGVAVGSAVGHTIANGVSSIFGGRGEASYAEASPVGQVQDQRELRQQEGKCDVDSSNLVKCMNENQGDIRVCQWYMDQLKLCLGSTGQSSAW